MPTTLTRRRCNNLKSLNLCFSNFMQPFFTSESPPISPTSSSILQQRDDQFDHNRPSHTTANTNISATSSSIMIKNFNTLYENNTFTLFEPEPESEPADFATAFASQRFFFSSPGRSNSIVESNNTDTSSSSSSLTATVTSAADESSAPGDNNKPIFNDSVAVPTYSPDPYMDFRRSMQEMVEARPELMNVESNWDSLHELLLCYLALNPKNTHSFILRAFSDLLVSLMPPPIQPQNPSPGSGGEC